MIKKSPSTYYTWGLALLSALALIALSCGDDKTYNSTVINEHCDHCAELNFELCQLKQQIGSLQATLQRYNDWFENYPSHPGRDCPQILKGHTFVLRHWFENYPSHPGLVVPVQKEAFND